MCHEMLFHFFPPNHLKNVKTILSLLTITKTGGRTDLALGYILMTTALDFITCFCFSLCLLIEERPGELMDVLCWSVGRSMSP